MMFNSEQFDGEQFLPESKASVMDSNTENSFQQFYLERLSRAYA